MLDNPLTEWQFKPPGFAAWVHVHGTDAALCTRNYQDSVFEAADAYAPDYFMRNFVKEGDCPGCPNNCVKFFSGGDQTRARTPLPLQEAYTRRLRGRSAPISDWTDSTTCPAREHTLQRASVLTRRPSDSRFPWPPNVFSAAYFPRTKWGFPCTLETPARFWR